MDLETLLMVNLDNLEQMISLRLNIYFNPQIDYSIPSYYILPL